MSEQSADDQRLELENRKFEFDRMKFQQESRFLNKNFGVIITAIVSVTAIVVSISQAYISYNSSIQQFEQERRKAERSYAFDIAKFLMERRDDINTSDVRKLRYVRQVVIASFPPEVVTQISSRMTEISDDDEARKVWADAYVFARSQSTPQPLSQPPKVSTSLTVDKLIQIFPEQRGREEDLNALLEAAAERQITTRNDLAIFFSFVFYETGSLKIKEENLNYRAERLVQIWPNKFPTLEAARAYERNPEKIANLVYDGKYGNTEPGDGYKYRGRGYVQLTGRDQYREAGQALSINLEGDPDTLLKDRKLNARVAAWYFASRTTSLRVGGSPIDFVQARRALSGGLIGLNDTKSYYDRIIAN